MDWRRLVGFPNGSSSKNLPAMQEIQKMRIQSPGLEVATHSSILAWRIPWTEESGGLVYGGHKELDTTEQLTLWLSSQSSHSSPALLICFQESWPEFMKKYSVPGWQEVLSKVNPMPGAGRFLETSESTMKWLWPSFAVLYIYIFP